MYLLIEHNGTEENTKLASKLRDIAEDDFGATCEYAIEIYQASLYMMMIRMS